MSGEAHVRSARTFSLVVLVLGYVGLSFAWAHYERLSVLMEARRSLIRNLAQGALADRPGGGDVPALGEVRLERGSDQQARLEGATVIQRSGGGWRVRFPIRSMFGVAPDRVPDADIAEIATEVGIFREESDPVRLYKEIENRLLGAEVTLPGTGLGFRGALVVWACALTLVGLLVVLRSRVEGAIDSSDLGSAEPWLVVDASRGLEVSLARLWLLGILVLPPLVSSGLLLTVAGGVIADGASSSLLSDGLTGTAVVTVLAANCWLALTTVGWILRLRARRRAAPAVSSSSSAVSRL